MDSHGTGKLDRNYAYTVYDTVTRKHWRRTTGTSDKRVAEEVVRRELQRLVFGDESADLQLAQAIELWLKELSLDHSVWTVRQCMYYGRVWCRDFGHRLVSDINSRDISQYIIGRHGKVKPTSVNQDLRVLRWFFKWAQKRGYVAHSPAMSVDFLHVDEKEVRVLSDQEVDRLFATTMSPQLKTFCTLALETGLRFRTLCTMTWDMVDWERGWLHIPPTHMKGRRPFSTPLSLDAIRVLKERLEDHPENPIIGGYGGRLRRNFNSLRERAGLPDDLTPHVFRKTFITRLLRRGVALEVVRKLSDHRDLKTLLKCYRGFGDQELEAAIRNLPRPDPPQPRPSA